MTDIEFYKATSGGKIDKIEKSVDSLHNRRSILIKDDISMTLWLIHGSGAAKKTQQSAENNAERINSDNEGKYNITEIEYDKAGNKIQEILLKTSTKPKKKATSPLPTPKLPKGKSSTKDAPLPKGEEESDGPQIEEFQIAYFTEETDDRAEDTVIIKQVLRLVAKYVDEIDKIVNDLPPKSKATGILNSLSKDILDLIYD